MVDRKKERADPGKKGGRRGNSCISERGNGINGRERETNGEIWKQRGNITGSDRLAETTKAKGISYIV